jgi:PEGA domain
MPALAPPQEPKMNTMRIATPMGYSSRPQRKVWPVVLGIALLLGIVGGAIAVAAFGNGASKPPGAGGSGASAPGAAAIAPRPAPDAGTATLDASAAGSSAGMARDAALVRDAGAVGDAAPRPVRDAGADASAAPGPGVATAQLSIESVPPGAVVTGPSGETLGRTPLTLEWPISPQPVTFELRLGGYRKKQKHMVVKGNTALRIELERASASHRPGGGDTAAGSANGSAGNGLMRPDE